MDRFSESQFSTCHNLAVAAVYGPLGLVDSFSALLAYSDVIFMSLLSDISAVYSAIFNYFCQCIYFIFQQYFHLMFNEPLFLSFEFKLSKILLCVVLLLRLD